MARRSQLRNVSRPEKDPALADLMQAAQLLQRGQRAEAIAKYTQASEKADDSAHVQCELGQFCRAVGDIDVAISHYTRAAQSAPEDPRYAALAGIAYLDAGDLDAAREFLETSLTLEPRSLEANHGLGVYYMRRTDYASALGYLELACELKPSEAGVRTNLATTLGNLNRHEEALAHARKSVKLDASNPGAQLVLSEMLSEIGEIDQAIKNIENTVRKHRSFGLAYDLLARLRKFSKEDEAFIGKAEKLLEKGMPPEDRSNLHFAVGKMRDDCGDYDEAFANYRQGNLLQKRDYNIAADKKFLKQIQAMFTTSSLRELSAMGHESAQPVFIVGMPRSGTTLMERIIASHALGAGSGELEEFPRIAREIVEKLESGDAAGAVLSRENLSAWAEGYLRILQQGHNEDAARIVDKLPSNCYLLGLIKALFPKATIIHAIRNPLDTCISCYFQSFSSLKWTNDLEVIGKMYCHYREVMDYWHRVLPEGSIVDVHYEKLVEDTEPEAQRMLEACGLEWDPSVLEFHRKNGVVRTASIAQTRRPIYKTSKMRWMKYASHLDPLAKPLAPYLESDRELLREHGIEVSKARGWLGRLFN